MPAYRVVEPGELVASTDRSVAAGQVAAADVDGPEATRHRDSVLALVAAHADVAERSCLPGHLTGSALVVDATATRTLLMLHRKLGRWFQPGGHADGDANLAAVALREATEETGVAGLRVLVPAIDVDVHEVRPPGEHAHLHLDVRFLVLAPDDPVVVANVESLALRWVSETELDQLDPPLDPGTRRLIAVGLRRARALLED